MNSPFEIPGSQTWRIGRELVAQTASLESCGVSRYRLRDGGFIIYRHEYTANVTTSEPAGAAIHVRSDIEVERPTGKVLIRTVSVFTPTSVSIQAEIEKDNQVIYSRRWQTPLP